MPRKKRKASQLAQRAPLLLWSAPPSVNGGSRPMIYRFADYELDVQLYQLRCNDVPVALEPKVFDVLAHLTQHQDRAISKKIRRKSSGILPCYARRDSNKGSLVFFPEKCLN